MTLGAYNRAEPADANYGSKRHRAQHERLYHASFFRECAAPKQAQFKARDGEGSLPKANASMHAVQQAHSVRIRVKSSAAV